MPRDLNILILFRKLFLFQTNTQNLLQHIIEWEVSILFWWGWPWGFFSCWEEITECPTSYLNGKKKFEPLNNILKDDLSLTHVIVLNSPMYMRHSYTCAAKTDPFYLMSDLYITSKSICCVTTSITFKYCFMSYSYFTVFWFSLYKNTRFYDQVFCSYFCENLKII